MILKLIILLFICSTVNAATVSVPTTYSTNGQVTATNLNGNFDALESTLNGGLDNTNANTTTGYRFFETKSSLPTAGSQGRVVFLTTDNTLNFDNGSSFTKSVSVSSPSNGDILYYNSGWNSLAVGSNGKSLTLSSGLPSWGYPAGLAITSQAQGDVLYYDGSNWVRLAAGTNNQVLKTQGAGANPTWANQVTAYDYGTSSSASTTYQGSSVKIAFGNISVANKSSTAITNLPFSSSTSYKCTANQVAGTLSLMNGPAAISYSSGSQASIHNASDTTFTESWICIGT